MDVATKPTVRRAKMEDIWRIQEMFARFVRTSQYRRYIGDNPDCAADMIAKLIAFESASVVFVVEQPDGKLTGMLGVHIFAQPYSGEIIANEAFWWLDYGHRGYGAFLLRRAERWARERGAKRILMMQPFDKKRVGEIYTALGYSPVEVTFSKDLV